MLSERSDLGTGFQSNEPKKTKIAPFQVEYTSNPVDIPSDLFASPPAKPITSRPVPFAASGLPEYEGKTAVILDNVLSPAECAQLLDLAEQSAVKAEDGASPWRPAMIALAPGWEAPAPGYRESDRIIWNEQSVVDRLWGRCLQAEGLKDLLATVPYQSRRGEDFTAQWELRRLNERMRFLKYSPGQYFKPHCDGPTWLEIDGIEFQTQQTLQLFLNDSAVESATGEGVVGGATAFLSRDKKRRLDVNIKAGSALIFQHSGLLHEGALVEKGIKYAMRTDIMYELVKEQRKSAK